MHRGSSTVSKGNRSAVLAILRFPLHFLSHAAPIIAPYSGVSPRLVPERLGMQDKLSSLTRRTDRSCWYLNQAFSSTLERGTGMNPAKFIPPRPIRILDRERLLDRLIEWEDRKLVVIHAQAGQGKTTLAAAYGRTLASPPVWYTMDPEDDDPGLLPLVPGPRAAARLSRERPFRPPAPSRPAVPELCAAAGAWSGQLLSACPGHA